MSRPLEAFLTKEAGAVTVDWVVLTAAMIVLVIGVFITVQTEVEGVASNLEESIQSQLNDGPSLY